MPIEAEGPYFRRAGDYIHLNPVRARLLEAGKPDLLRYPWSSFPQFARSTQLPVWLRWDRIFSSLELPDEAAGSLRRLIKTRTSVGDGWIVERLVMGHRSNVTRAVVAFRNPAHGIRKQLQRVLHVCAD